MASKPRIKMPVAERAKQFMPFAAVKGLEEALAQKERELGLGARAVLSEEAAEAVNAALTALVPGARAAVTYYAGGEYITLHGPVERVDPMAGVLYIGGAAVPIADIDRVER